MFSTKYFTTSVWWCLIARLNGVWWLSQCGSYEMGLLQSLSNWWINFTTSTCPYIDAVWIGGRFSQTFLKLWSIGMVKYMSIMLKDRFSFGLPTWIDFWIKSNHCSWAFWVCFKDFNFSNQKIGESSTDFHILQVNLQFSKSSSSKKLKTVSPIVWILKIVLAIVKIWCVHKGISLPTTIHLVLPIWN